MISLSELIGTAAFVGSPFVHIYHEISLNEKSWRGGGESPLTWTSILSVKPVGTGLGVKGVFKLYPLIGDVMIM